MDLARWRRPTTHPAMDVIPSVDALATVVAAAGTGSPEAAGPSGYPAAETGSSSQAQARLPAKAPRQAQSQKVAAKERAQQRQEASSRATRTESQGRAAGASKATARAAAKEQRSPAAGEAQRRAAVRQADTKGDNNQQRRTRVASGSAASPRLDDLQLLARLVTIEAGNEPYEGQVAVAAVVLNRVRHRQFPNSVRAVIFAPGQFPAAARMIDRIKPKASALQAARDALSGKDPSQGAVFFYNPQQHRCDGGSGDFFCSLEITARIGQHVFAK